GIRCESLRTQSAFCYEGDRIAIEEGNAHWSANGAGRQGKRTYLCAHRSSAGHVLQYRLGSRDGLIAYSENRNWPAEDCGLRRFLPWYRRQLAGAPTEFQR